MRKSQQRIKTYVTWNLRVREYHHAIGMWDNYSKANNTNFNSVFHPAAAPNLHI